MLWSLDTFLPLPPVVVLCIYIDVCASACVHEFIALADRRVPDRPQLPPPSGPSRQHSEPPAEELAARPAHNIVICDAILILSKTFSLFLGTDL